MKRLIVFAGLLALLAGMVVYPIVDDAQAQSRVMIRPFTTPYAYSVRATAATALLETPTSDLMGFYVTASGDSAIGRQSIRLSMYHPNGDSTILTAYLPDNTAGPLVFPFPNVRVSGFRVAITNGTVTSPVLLHITGWY